MPFFVYGRNVATGEVAKRLFSEASSAEAAREHGRQHGLEVSAVVPCREQDRPRDIGMQPAARAKSAAPERRQEVEQFRETLEQLTPTTWATYVLAGANVLVFLAMAFGGADLANPSVADLLKWGADFGPLTLHGQGWRLFSSMFVHIGFMHLLYNMLAFAYGAQIVERMIGSVGFLLLYGVSGLGGGLLALYSNAMLVHAGASGAVFGVFGCMLALVLMQGRSIPPHVASSLGRFALIFIGYNLINSLRPNISMAAHVGGLLTGFVCGVLLAQPVASASLAVRPLRAAMALTFGLALFAAGMAGAQARYPDLYRLQELLGAFDALDTKDAKLGGDMQRKVRHQDASEAEYADLIDRDLLPEWQRMRASLGQYAVVPHVLQTDVADIVDYMRAREQGWMALSEGLRTRNRKQIDAAQDKLRDVDSTERRLLRTARAHFLLAPQ